MHAEDRTTHLFVGTMKGLFHFTSTDRATWQRISFDFAEQPVYTTAFDPSTGTLFAGVNGDFFGMTVQRSQDLGASWKATATAPSYGADDPEKVTRVWSFLPSPEEGEGVVYAGVEASGLFRSADGGDTWTEVASLRRHPTHETWNPGNGGKCLHTIRRDPNDPDRLYIAASAGGIYRSDDRGTSWRPVSKGIRSDFMPEPMRYPESGQCVHKFGMPAGKAGRIWLQNHGGVYRSDDGGDTWVRVDEELPSDFGFPVVAHPHNPDSAWIVPLGGDGGRWCVNHQLGVYRTDNAGNSWRSQHQGLPDQVWTGVLRNAMTADREPEVGLYFGTTVGGVWSSPDEGDSWHEAARNLPRVLSVEVVGPRR